jgi:hypothetical protein
VALRLRHLTDLPFFSQVNYGRQLVAGARAPLADLFYDLIRSAGVDLVFVIALMRNCLPYNMASVSLNPPAFMVVLRPQVISSKCRANTGIIMLFQLLMDFELRQCPISASISVGVREQLSVYVSNKLS